MHKKGFFSSARDPFEVLGVPAQGVTQRADSRSRSLTFRHRHARQDRIFNACSLSECLGWTEINLGSRARSNYLKQSEKGGGGKARHFEWWICLLNRRCCRLSEIGPNLPSAHKCFFFSFFTLLVKDLFQRSGDV